MWSYFTNPIKNIMGKKGQKYSNQDKPWPRTYSSFGPINGISNKGKIVQEILHNVFQLRI